MLLQLGPFNREWKAHIQHDIVTDYIHIQAYASTARVLAKPRTWGRDRTNGDGVGGNGDVDMDAADESRIEEDVLEREEAGEAGEGSGTGLLSEDSLVNMERRRGEPFISLSGLNGVTLVPCVCAGSRLTRY